MSPLELKRLNYPRVSDIIGVQTAPSMRMIPIDVMANACLRGTTVHNYCTTYAKGLFVPEIEEEYIPYFEAFKGWYDANVAQLIGAAERLYCDPLQYSGEYDLVVKLKSSEELALVDIKTSANVSKSWPVQLAAYEFLLSSNDIKTRIFYNLHLKRGNGKVKANVVQYSYDDINQDGWKVFSTCLECYNYFNRKEKE